MLGLMREGLNSPLEVAVSLGALAPTVRLERLDDRFLGELAGMFADREVQRHTRVPLPVPPGYEQMWLDLYEQGRLERSREAFAILDADTAAFLGTAVAPRIETHAQTVELGYIVVRQARCRRVATAALRQLSDWAFRNVGALRLELLITVDNAASKRVAARCGYVREGVMRSFFWKEGRRDNVELWSRLAADLPAPRSAR